MCVFFLKTFAVENAAEKSEPNVRRSSRPTHDTTTNVTFCHLQVAMFSLPFCFQVAARIHTEECRMSNVRIV